MFRNLSVCVPYITSNTQNKWLTKLLNKSDCFWIESSNSCLLYATSLYHYLLTPWSRVPLEKLTGLQLVKKFPAFYGTRMFLTALTSARHVSLSWSSPTQSPYPHPTSRKIHPNIILPSTPGSPQRSLSLRFPHQNPVHTFPFPSLSHSAGKTYDPINCTVTGKNVNGRASRFVTF
jgi:hypothetical protein